MNARVDHTDVGAYALGLLEDGDRRAFEAHLRGCGRCRAELAELSGTAGALRDLGGEAPFAAEPADAPPAPVVGCLHGDPRLQAGEESDPRGAGQGTAHRRRGDGPATH